MTRLATRKKRAFDPRKFLATIGEGRRVVAFPKKQTIFMQGDAADAVFYIQKGKVRLTVVSKIGREATLGILGAGDFFGEGGLAGQPLRVGSATALTDCELLQIDKKAMMLALHREHAFSDLFVAYLLARNIRYEGSNVALACSLRQGRCAPDCNPKDQSGDPRRDGGHNPVAGQFFHESIQKVRLR